MTKQPPWDLRTASLPEKTASRDPVSSFYCMHSFIFSLSLSLSRDLLSSLGCVHYSFLPSLILSLFFHSFLPPSFPFFKKALFLPWSSPWERAQHLSFSAYASCCSLRGRCQTGSPVAEYPQGISRSLRGVRNKLPHRQASCLVASQIWWVQYSTCEGGGDIWNPF